ncbi:MAG TPA: transglutaminase domain-containing protein [Syntrophomonadaceae bacterium]|nr:transglutaminase domain-containing protein [Syntrophomonadaceae bacterium]
MREYLQATAFLDADHPDIIHQTMQVVSSAQHETEKAVHIFYFVRDQIRYNMYACVADAKTLKASYVLQQGEGWCLQKAILFTAMARAAGIPSQLILTSIKNHKAPPEVWDLMGSNIFFPHAYNLLYLDGRWVKAAATFDADLCRRLEVSAVEFDGRKDAVLPAYDKLGQPFIEYIGPEKAVSDLPLSWILERSMEIYKDYYKNWIKES